MGRVPVALPSLRARALLLTTAGAILVAAGVWLLAGPGWALCALGGATIVEGLLMETGPRGVPNRAGGAVRPPLTGTGSR